MGLDINPTENFFFLTNTYTTGFKRDTTAQTMSDSLSTFLTRSTISCFRSFSRNHLWLRARFCHLSLGVSSTFFRPAVPSLFLALLSVYCPHVFALEVFGPVCPSLVSSELLSRSGRDWARRPGHTPCLGNMLSEQLASPAHTRTQTRPNTDPNMRRGREVARRTTAPRCQANDAELRGVLLVFVIGKNASGVTMSSWPSVILLLWKSLAGMNQHHHC